MRIATAGPGVAAALRALATQVKPRFMAPALAASAYGALLAGVVDPAAGGLHLAATFLALHTAHVKDGLVDTYRRGEDASLPLTDAGARAAVAGGTVGTVAVAVALGATAGALAGLLVLPPLVLGLLHAPWLDRHPVGTSADYAVAVAVVVLGGFAAQAGTLTATAVGLSLVLVPAVAAGAVLLDVADLRGDRRLGKETVAVRYGAATARLVALGLVGLAAALVVELVVAGLVPPVGVVAAVPFVLGALGTRAPDPARGLALMMAGTALAMTLLLVAAAGLP